MCPIDPNGFSPRGVYAPTITAFEKDEAISLEGTRAFVRFLLAQGVDGLVPLGSSGEPLALSMMERKTVLDAVMAEAGAKVPVKNRGFTGREGIRSRNGEEWMSKLRSLGW